MAIKIAVEKETFKVASAFMEEPYLSVNSRVRFKVMLICVAVENFEFDVCTVCVFGKIDGAHFRVFDCRKLGSSETVLLESNRGLVLINGLNF